MMMIIIIILIMKIKMMKIMMTMMMMKYDINVSPERQSRYAWVSANENGWHKKYPPFDRVRLQAP